MSKKMPDGWVSIKWKDAKGRKFTNNVPKVMKTMTIMNVESSGGRIIKITD